MQTIEGFKRLELPVDLKGWIPRHSRKLVITPEIFQISVWKFYSIFSRHCTFKLSKIKKNRYFEPKLPDYYLKCYQVKTFRLKCNLRSHAYLSILIWGWGKENNKRKKKYVPINKGFKWPFLLWIFIKLSILMMTYFPQITMNQLLYL